MTKRGRDLRVYLALIIITGVLFASACSSVPPQRESSSAALQPAAKTPSQTPGATQAVKPTPSPTVTPTFLPEDSPVPTAAASEASQQAMPATASNPQAVTATPQAASTATANAAGDCKDAAAFYADVSVPDGTLFRPSESFTKTWRVRNLGDCAWENGYALVFAGAEILNAASSTPLPAVAPGEVADVSVVMRAPDFGGQYVSHWLFINPSGQTFGVGINRRDTLWVMINVTYTGRQTSAPASSQANAPQTNGFDNPAAMPPATISGQVVPPLGCSAQRNPAFESQVLALINQARQNAGLSPLSLRQELANAALVHSYDMVCNSLLSHIGSDGANWYARVAAQGYANSSSARENIYAGSPEFGGDPQGAVNWWMNSQIHRDNILNPNVTEIGVGYAFSPTSQFGGYYTLVFAKPWDYP